MRAGLRSLGLLATLMLTGCDGTAQSVEWYKAHDKERNAKFEACRKASNPRGTEDCRNAITATVHAGSNITRSKPKSWTLDGPEE